MATALGVRAWPRSLLRSWCSARAAHRDERDPQRQGYVVVNAWGTDALVLDVALTGVEDPWREIDRVAAMVIQSVRNAAAQ